MILSPRGPVPAGLPVYGLGVELVGVPALAVGPGPYAPGSPVGILPPGCPLTFSPPSAPFGFDKVKEKVVVNGHLVRRGKPCYMMFQPVGTRELTPAGYYGPASSDAKFSWANRFALLQLMQQQQAILNQVNAQRRAAGYGPLLFGEVQG